MDALICPPLAEETIVNLSKLKLAEKMVINLSELPSDKAEALREMFGPFATIVEALAAIMGACSLDGDELTIPCVAPLEKVPEEPDPQAIEPYPTPLGKRG